MKTIAKNALKSPIRGDLQNSAPMDVSDPDRHFAMGCSRFAKGIRFPASCVLADFANSDGIETPQAHLEVPAGDDPRPGARGACVANAVPTTIGEDGWMRLSAYGEHAYGEKDVQVVDRNAAKAMVGRFKSAANALARALFLSSPTRPVYRGHPDHPHFSAQGHDDFTLRAEITDVDDREDGLYILPRWTDAGNELRARGGKLWWSPRWLLELIRTGPDGRRYWAPYKLVSAGLTPTPNILGSAANSQPNPNMNKIITKLLAALGYSPEQAADAANAAESAPPADEVEAKLDRRLDAANNYYSLMQILMRALGYSDEEIDAFSEEKAAAPTQEDVQARLEERLSNVNTLDTANSDLTKKLQDMTTERDKALTDCANERKERAILVVGQAVDTGRLSPTDREARIQELAGAEDFANSATALLTAKQILPVGGKQVSSGLGRRTGEMQDMANAVEVFHNALRDWANENQRDLDGDYSRTYAAFARTKEGQRLHKAMRDPDAAGA